MRPSLLLAFSALTVLALPLAGATASLEASAPCSGGICDTINRVCGDCLPSDADARCMGPVCDAVNRVCYRVFGVGCLG